ncbi:MAG: ephrin type-A/B receptor [Bacteroidetes bacterium]|nr:ephrin type-A/B receptor [Bacteroidota bacterium]
MLVIKNVDKNNEVTLNYSFDVWRSGMKIISSTLSMDASASHTDVKKKGKGIMTVGSLSQSSITNFSLKPYPVISSTTSNHHEVKKEFSVESKVTTEAGQTCHHDEKSTAVIHEMVEGVLGREVEVTLKTEESKSNEKQQELSNQKDGGLRVISTGGGPFQMAFTSYSLTYESQYVDVSSNGSLTTKDGRKIEFSMELTMAQKSLTYSSLALRASAGLFVDPLILNFDNSLDFLEETTFSFDINGDGNENKIATLASGSGFLALDSNGDSKINNGKELFGPLSGNGFLDLQAYDMDENMWIDENNPIFEKLTVWMGAGGEGDKLVTLKEAGVGAIALSHTESEFNLKNSNHETVARVAASGLFLTEAGEVRSLQEIDYNLQRSDSLSTGRKWGEETEQAFALLRMLLAHHRQRLDSLISSRLMSVAKTENKHVLQDKVWKWQEMEVEQKKG